MVRISPQTRARVETLFTYDMSVGKRRKNYDMGAEIRVGGLGF